MQPRSLHRDRALVVGRRPDPLISSKYFLFRFYFWVTKGLRYGDPGESCPG